MLYVVFVSVRKEKTSDEEQTDGDDHKLDTV